MIIFNKPFISQWVSRRIPGDDEFPLNTANVGLIKNGKLVAGVVYTMDMGNGCMMSVASDGSRAWLNKDFLRAAFWYPFVKMDYTRVTGLVRTDNVDAQRFDEHLGFKREGLLRKGDDDGTDLIIYGMLKEECRWIHI